MGRKIEPERILLSGYYGFGNTGDEAILQSAVRAFQKRGVGVIALSHNPAASAQELQVEAFGRRRFSDILKAIHSASLVLSGGGGLLQDKTSFKSLLYYLRIPFLAKLMGKKTMVFGQGIGPVESPRGKFLTRLVCNWFVDRITVRDEGSKELLQSLGVKKPIEVTADLAFLLNPVTEEEKREARSRLGLDSFDRPFAGVVLRQWEGMGRLLPEISKGLCAFARAQGLVPVLLSFQPGEDERLVEQLDSSMNLPHLKISRTLPVRDLISLISNFSLLVGMRYHSLVFAAITGVPFVAISYDPKVEHFARALRFPLLNLAGLTASMVESILEEAWGQKEKYHKILEEEIPGMRKKAGINVERAMELLREPATHGQNAENRV